MQTVYIETTIPSYYFETRRASTVAAWRGVTREWWARSRRHYRLVTSQYVMAELGLTPKLKARKALDLLRRVEVLDEPEGLQEVAEFYIAHRLMPVEAGGDAVHLAFASLHKMDYLLTWNCRHLANANKTQHLRVLNGRLGLAVPVISTPLTLLGENR